MKPVKKDDTKLNEILSSPHKIGILYEIRTGEKSSLELQKSLEMEGKTLNYHLNVLASYGFLQKNEIGNYSMTPDGLALVKNVDEAVKKSPEIVIWHPQN